jgi:predicted dehydrogenase
MLQVALIGYGYWGPNIGRNFNELEGARVAAVADLSEERRAAARRKLPGARVLESAEEAIRDPEIDAVAVCTPLSSHYELARMALEAGKHVLVEKPMTASSAEAQALVELAERAGRVLMVDHTFCYHGAVRCIKKIIDRGDLGRIYYFDSVRINLGAFQADTNVIWDLAPHDLSIMDYLLGAEPVAAAAHGVSHFGDRENVAYLYLEFKDKLIGHVHVNWLAPVKVRQTIIGGEKRMIIYDDLAYEDKVRVYDKGVSVESREDVYKTLIKYRTGDMWAPQYEQQEALAVECRHFLECIRTGSRPLTDGRAGLRVVKILEAAARSMAEGGRMVKL